MATNSNSAPKRSNYVNWGTVWGLIFTAIALDLYINYSANQQDKETYRIRYETKVSEADSLRAVKSKLERQLLEIKAMQSPTTATATVMASNEVSR
ncbi:hypothetical protein ACFPMF_09910 [Larkinella bovis]|uniref:S-adenosyl-methyltransferase n=1 Tax=Larkinella bovis TaxID=683041 RepID=A0ABW0IAQ7_9BACT